ncbi:ArsC family reductase [Pontibacterium sp.]|uniref:ArsC family reductase n=1 Tax=Pontibacterium sp. TaxID=2036026 RepID=UPI003569D69C
MITMYGIKNCDTIKKARKWLEAEGIEYQFHDYRKDGLDANQLKSWVSELGWEVLLNKRGATWRKLPDDVKNNVDEASAIEVMLDNPAIIKRPLLDTGDVRTVGFKDADYASLLGQ